MFYVFALLIFSFFVKIASSVAVKKDCRVNPHELRKHFPDFLWLLRDVTLLPADEDGKEISPTDYLLKRVLVEGGDFDESTSDKVGRAIVTFFPSINCITLPPPSADVGVMRNIEKNEDNLNPEFNMQINDLLIFLRKHILTKKVFDSGESVTGVVMAHLTQQFVIEVNDPNNTPALTSTWDSTIKLLIAEVQDRLVEEYSNEFTKIYEEESKGGPLEEGDINGEGQSLPKTMLGIHHALMLDKNKVLAEEVGRFCTSTDSESSFTHELLLTQLKIKILEVKKEKINDHEGREFERDVVTGGVLFIFTQRNQERSRKQCQKVFDELYEPIKNKVNASGGKYTFDDLRHDLKNLHKNYFSQAIGPAKWEIYSQAQETIKQDEETFHRLAGYEQKLLEADAKIAEGIQQNQQMFESIHQLRQQISNEAAENKANMLMMQKQHEESMRNMEAQFKQREEIEKRKYDEFMMTQRERQAERIQQDSQQQMIMHREIINMVSNQCEKNMETMKYMVNKMQPPPPKSGESVKYSYLT